MTLNWGFWFNAFWDVFDASWHAAVVALVVVAAHILLRRHLPARWRFALWFLVLLRFTYPYGSFPASSRWSLFNWFPTTAHAGRVLPQPLRPRAYGTEPLERASHPITADPTTWVPSRPSAIAWDHLLVIVWLTGIAAVALRLSLASLSLRRILRRAQPITDHPAVTILESARRAVDLRVSVRLLRCPDISTPAITGIIRPRLLVPPHLLESLSPAELRHVFLHECTHIRREDVLLNYWLALISIIHWYNPILWLLLPRIRADRELACDEAVLAKGEPAAAYGQTLLKILEISAARPFPVGAIGIIESKSFVQRRIRMIAAFRRTPAWIAFPALALTVTLAASTLTSAVSKAAAPAAASTPATAPADSAPTNRAQLDQALIRRYHEFVTDRLPLDKTFQKLQQLTHITFNVDWDALSPYGINQQTPVSLDMHDDIHHDMAAIGIFMEIQTAIGKTHAPRLEFHSTYEKNGSITFPHSVTITRPEPGPNDPVMHVYDVRDLVFADSMADDGRPLTADERAIVDQVVGAISANIPANLKDPRNTIIALNGSVVVTARADCQKEVSYIIQQLAIAHLTSVEMHKEVNRRKAAAATRAAP